MQGITSTYGVAGAINKAACNNTTSMTYTTRNVKQHEHQILDSPAAYKTRGYSMTITEPSHETLVLTLNPSLKSTFTSGSQIIIYNCSWHSTTIFRPE
jgi:hypothetical protein